MFSTSKEQGLKKIHVCIYFITSFSYQNYLQCDCASNSMPLGTGLWVGQEIQSQECPRDKGWFLR